ncbi:MAG: ABC transporter ATP-binding protein [Candidatus Bathyarchaeia archaeon]
MDVIAEAKNLKKWFPVRLGFFKTLFSKRSLFVRAVDGISFYIRKKEILGLVGESGSGKTTTGRLMLRLLEPTGGQIFFEGRDITHLKGEQLRSLRQKMQIVFQDPYESLNPRMTIGDIVAEPIRVLKLANDEKEVMEKVYSILEDVQLIPPEEFVFRYPHELSGGQRQRVNIARAFVVNPKFIVADEPVSMLDVSTRAEILDLMTSLRDKYSTAFLYITHDLALTKHVCDRIAVMYLGKIVEAGQTDDIIDNPMHPYTKALISAVPVPDPDSRRIEVTIKGEIPSPINIPPGCRFHTRCPSAMGICQEKEPELIEIEKGRFVACHLWKK